MSNHPLLYNIRAAFKENLIPAIFLQFLALFVCISYFYWPAAKPVFLFFAALKETYGAVYAILSTSLFGGAIPFAYLWLSKKIQHNLPGQFVFYLLMWAMMGAFVDALYNFQAQLFGSDASLATIVKKVLFDQCLFTALFSCPLLTVMYLWKDQGFSWQRTKTHLTKELFTLKIPTVILTNWVIWFPAVSVVYAMPTPLQIPLFNLVLCFFVLLLSMLSKRSADTTADGKLAPV
ncbi:hypothetical protein [Marinibactrum halimedae]|uniref:Uncharacterized protein n=1 Tax=Marinibactrum halimedae TaxID=1444977 RepID=A0AA37T5L6_9GAMM|nr:hypothetical protein [Marinibactrum halimedae]MCD9460801.1 hypothetical protein [Marinibactrum halimedae]GLS27390.1 hypothetical protein GCM10007877_31090 [Marinibactrum halimedae]